MLRWFKRLVSGKPHLSIGGDERPYMRRWYCIPRNPWLNVYLHQFLRDDDDRALHDHPWWFISIMLWGSYTEWRIEPSIWHGRGFPESTIEPRRRRAGSIAFRSAETRHRVTLNGKPCWTLVITGRKKRTWGFWCPRGFVPWHEFTKPGNEGEIGKGCD